MNNKDGVFLRSNNNKQKDFGLTPYKNKQITVVLGKGTNAITKNDNKSIQKVQQRFQQNFQRNTVMVKRRFK